MLVNSIPDTKNLGIILNFSIVKEVIMKKLIFWMVLIVGTVVLLGSCAKKEETDDAAATSCATDTTASGSITVGSETMSGVYLSTCNTGIAASAGTQIFPSDVKSGYMALVVTGDAAISEEFLMYTDTTCSTPSLTFKNGRTDFTVGSASGSNYAVTYKASAVKVKPSTDVAKSHLDAFATSTGQSLTFTVGSETSVTDSGSTKYNLVSVTSTTVQTGDSSDNATPTSLDDGSLSMTKACQ